MNKNKPILKALCAATIIALGSSAYAERVIVTHDASDNGLKKGHQVLVNGNGWFAVDLDENGKSAMRSKKGFKNMEVDAKRFPASLFNDTAGIPDQVQVTPYGYFQAQADQVTLQNSGVKVCVIDSGIAGMQGETGNRNDDFVWANISGDNDPTGTGNWNADGGPHGTHVAGTIGAADNNIGVIGMAPGVPMHIIKVFTEAGYTYSSNLAQAANLCAAAGAGIINMSLTGPVEVSVERAAFENFQANGGLSLGAAGNDGNNARHFPGGYESVAMIGAVDADNVIADFSQFPACITTGKGKKRALNASTCVELSAGGVATLSTVSSGYGDITSLVADGSPFSAVGTVNKGSVTGASFDFALGEAINTAASGKVCVISRGNISFYDKIRNCEDSGGIGAVVYNNEAGAISMDLGLTNDTTIPAVSALQADGAALLAATSITIDVASSDYAKFDGTSMATPTVAGIAALVWSNHSTCSGEEIRNALRATAQDQGTSGRDNYYGFGIVKAKAASDYLTANSCSGTEPPPPGGDATLSGSRSKGGRQANLSWNGLNGTNVDVYINGALNNTTANDGSASYTVNKSTSYTFEVCEAGTTTCTNSITL